MSRITVAAAVMGGAKVRSAEMSAPAAPSAAFTTAATTPTAFTSASASASALATGERHICGTKPNPEHAHTCGKSQDDNKPNDKLFADRAHDVFLPQKGVPCGAWPTPFWYARSATSATVMLRCTEKRVAAAITVARFHLIALPPGMAEIRSSADDHVRGGLSLTEIK